MKLRSEYISKTKENRLYHLPVPIIGLTGGIATGKSTVAKMFKDLGLNVLDADSLVKKIYAKTEAIDFVKTHFPQAYQNNAIQFKVLREIVFSNSFHQEVVEKFIYSHLPETFLNAFHELPAQSLLIYDVPLLFEKKLNESVDCSICVYTSREIQ
jgi:dephospho-CoA kinase